MRHVLLLLIFCISFGVLDSITRRPTPLHTDAPPLTFKATKADRPNKTTKIFKTHKVVKAHKKVVKVEPVVEEETGWDDVATSDLTTLNDSMSKAPLPELKDENPLAEFAAEATDQTRPAIDKPEPIHNTLLNPHGVQFGGIAGLNVAGAAATSNNDKVSGKPLTGFNLGLFADIPLKKHVSFRPKVEYSYEGYQPSVGGDKINVRVAYLSSTLDMVYHDKRLFAGIGPYIGSALNGTYTLKGINTDMVFGNNFANGDNLRKLDYGANIMAGILMDKNFVLCADVNLGLRNISPSGSDAHILTRSAGVSLLYVFRNRPLF